MSPRLALVALALAVACSEPAPEPPPAPSPASAPDRVAPVGTGRGVDAPTEPDELGASLAITMAARQPVFAPGAEILVDLDIRNPEGAPPVRVRVIEDQRVRSFEVVVATRGDALVARPVGMVAFSVLGGSRWERIEGGQSATRQTLSIGDRLDTSEPGSYRVTLATTVELAAADEDPDAPSRRARTREVSGVVTFEVR